ncbi:MAG: 2-C-methyl-D-erythritol 2,4-cyclodiphosphate synthase [Actinobacteria bacterium]|nr:MAG: 2-C-methyl-D-erythritol 2,4-cyclodiphosphate synthase [Actinomycetota bacterium]
MADVRTGIGYDAHRFGGDGPVVLAGVVIDHPVGVIATSDGDVAAHAVCDALLGAVAAGDLGTFFPSSDPQWEGADSLELLRSSAATVTEAGYAIGSIDVTIIVQSVRVAPHRDQMRRRLAGAMGIDVDRVSVKATSTDGLGRIGAEAGLAAQAVATVHM